MHDHAHDAPIPRLLLRAVMGLVLFSIVAVLVGQFTERGLVMNPPVEAAEEIRLSFDAQPDGIMVVRAADTGATVAVLAADGDGFIRGVLRGLERGRAINRLADAPVYLLTRSTDGRLTISDPETGERIDLNGFGADNLAAFARLLPSRGNT
jgi:putative photosynthetic complex assembly protein